MFQAKGGATLIRLLDYMTKPEKKAEQDQKELKKFVEKIAALFEKRDIGSVEMLEKQEKKPHAAYLLRELPSSRVSQPQTKIKEGRSFVRVIPDYEFKEGIRKTLISSAEGAHRLTLKQNLHFDAFKKLLLEKGLIVKHIIDWKLHSPGKGLLKIREWGKNYSAVERDPNFSKRVFVIMRKD